MSLDAPTRGYGHYKPLTPEEQISALLGSEEIHPNQEETVRAYVTRYFYTSRDSVQGAVDALKSYYENPLVRDVKPKTWQRYLAKIAENLNARGISDTVIILFLEKVCKVPRERLHEDLAIGKGYRPPSRKELSEMSATEKQLLGLVEIPTDEEKGRVVREGMEKRPASDFL